MNRLIPWLLVLSTVLTLAACSGDDTDEPPRAEIVYPDPGYRYTTAPDSMVVDAVDDRGISSVEFRLDGVVVATARRSPYSTRLPLGIYADGREHVLDATARDSRGATGTAGPVVVTIDPSLQTVPQIVEFAEGPADPGTLRLVWLQWPAAVTRYEWEVASDDGFVVVVAGGAASDTLAATGLDLDRVAYARVRTVAPTGTSDWSRPARFSGLATWRQRYGLAEPQLGAAIYRAGDGTLRVLSHAVEHHRVSRAPVQLLILDEVQALVAAPVILSDEYLPTCSAQREDGSLVLAGLLAEGSSGFLAAAGLDGALLWSVTTDVMAPTALVAAPDGSLLAVGADRRDGQAGGVFAAVGAAGELTPGTGFPLEAGREVLLAWPRPAGGWVLAGSLADPNADRPEGIWALGLDPAGAVLWNIRLGTGDRWLLRGGGADGAGDYALGGIALRDEGASRYGFLVGFDERGRVRWQFRDSEWHLFAGIAPAVGDRWVTVGARRRAIDDSHWTNDLALRGFDAFGASLWESRLAAGLESQGWTLAAHPGGGWWAAGVRTDDGSAYDVDLLRVDDLGNLE
ncbi:MAG TPA: Ig-like domain-containing protein [Candidatus Krumholzibacteria bacterium]|nr:Ig-like domain-containing protein [Candidatus Krumholzibacteria bacterium]HPD72316.1 Ig-like domain-containing protein [Candidatus Krumholzibacteria bacterium]HRY40752.1 Ig-like domain-containing protein [Candidatus Krumholzibacteria bacterium]